MICNRVQIALSAYLDGELGSPEMLSVRRHLSGCPECREELAQMRAIKSLLTVGESFVPPADFENRLFNHVFGETRKASRPANRFAIGAISLTAAIAAIFFAVQLDKSITPKSIAQEPASVPHFDVNRDQAYAAGYDGFGGLQVALPASNEKR